MAHTPIDRDELADLTTEIMQTEGLPRHEAEREAARLLLDIADSLIYLMHITGKEREVMKDDLFMWDAGIKLIEDADHDSTDEIRRFALSRLLFELCDHPDAVMKAIGILQEAIAVDHDSRWFAEILGLHITHGTPRLTAKVLREALTQDTSPVPSVPRPTRPPMAIWKRRAA